MSSGSKYLLYTITVSNKLGYIIIEWLNCHGYIAVVRHAWIYRNGRMVLTGENWMPLCPSQVHAQGLEQIQARDCLFHDMPSLTFQNVLMEDVLCLWMWTFASNTQAYCTSYLNSLNLDILSFVIYTVPLWSSDKWHGIKTEWNLMLTPYF
jgi:hypothetical protein